MNKFEDSKQNDQYNLDTEEKAMSMAFFPLTLPMICGPGTITVAITLGANALSKDLASVLVHFIGVTIGIVLASLSAYFSYYYAGYLTQRLGKNGTLVIMKLSAFISLCIGLTIIWKGIQALIPC